jgi:chromosome segregation ATPase
MMVRSAASESHRGDLADRVDLVGDESHQALTEAVERIDKLEQELTAGAEQSKSAFSALNQKAHDFEAQVAELLAKVQSSVDHLQGVRDEIHNRIVEESEHHQQELGALAGLVDQLEIKLGEHWDESHDEIKGFLGQVGEHLDEFKEHHDQLLADIEHFHENHGQLFQEVVEGLGSFESQSGDLLNNLVSHVEGLTEQGVGQIAQKFGGDVVENLLQISEPLSAVFGVVNEVAGGSHDSFLDKFEEITGNADQVAEIINSIKPALDLIEEML